MKKSLIIPTNIQQKKLDLRSTINYIKNHLNDTENNPFFLGRFGGVEARIIDEILLQRRIEASQKSLEQAKFNAGIIPPNRLTLKRFSVETLAAGMMLDILAIWSYESQIKVANFVNINKYTELNFINPLWSFKSDDLDPWTKYLDGKKVLVIHPFIDSLSVQLENINNIENINKIWSKNTDFILYKPAVTFAGEGVGLNWYDELLRMKNDIAALDFDVALIGAGAYGLSLGAFVKGLGKKAFHLGGILQLLFGIIGSRWEKDSFYNSLMGNGWVRPMEHEIPRFHHRIDKSSYW